MTFVHCTADWCKDNDALCCSRTELELLERGPYVYVICGNSEFKNELKEEYGFDVEGREQI